MMHLCLQPLFAQYVIYTGGSVSGVATATVKKASSKKLSISLEGKGHVKYEAEGDFAEFVYSVSRSGDKVAQVHCQIRMMCYMLMLDAHVAHEATLAE